MKKLADIEALKIIVDCAKSYEKHLVNKNFLFVYKGNNGEYGFIEVLFKPKHFQHLTGNNKTKGSSAIHFYSKCIDNTLNVSDIHKSELMDLKLSVLPMLMKIHKNARMLGNSDGSTVCRLETDKFIGHVTGSLGFRYDAEEEFLVPVTALEGDIRKITVQSNQIMAVYSKPYDAELYSVICYVAKNSDISKKDISEIVWTKGIEAKIDKNKLKYE